MPSPVLHEGRQSFSLYRKLPGVTLDRAAYRALNGAQRARLAEDLAGFLFELHRLPRSTIETAGARRIGSWDTDNSTLAPVWAELPREIGERGRAAIAAYQSLPPDPLGETFGFFDAHGWNMAFDIEGGALHGIFDFADSGIGPIHREFVPVSLVDPDLAWRTLAAYGMLTGVRLDRRRVYLLTAAMRLSEYAGALESGMLVGFSRDLVVDWLSQSVPTA